MYFRQKNLSFFSNLFSYFFCKKVFFWEQSSILEGDLFLFHEKYVSTKLFVYKNTERNPTKMWKELFPPKNWVSIQAIFDYTNFRHNSMGQSNLIEQFCDILCKLFILDIFFLTPKVFFFYFTSGFFLF